MRVGRAMSIAAVLSMTQVPVLNAAAGRHDLPAGPTRFEAKGSVSTTWVDPIPVLLSDGSTETSYYLPDGTVMTSVTPPSGFDPLTADESTLARYGFPVAPSDPVDYQFWYDAMKAFKSDEPPTEPLKWRQNNGTFGAQYALPYTSWGGYWAGTGGVQSQTYVAVKANLTVPTNTGTCSSSSQVSFWIGLGGTGGQYDPYNLVQQGIECGNPLIGTGSSYRPFTEFVAPDPNGGVIDPLPFCGYSSWTLAAGHVIYQNMSFQTSQNKAFFYLQDQTSGVANSCSRTGPTGFHWDLNTAEWIGEAPYPGHPINFGGVQFSNARAQLYSNSTWVTLGSQPHQELIQGSGLKFGIVYKCIDPGLISSGTTFLDDWTSSQCYYEPN